MTSTACGQDAATRTRDHIANGDKYARAGKYREASIDDRNAIKRTPNSTEAHEKLADAAARAEDPQTALDAVLRLGELKPDDPAAQVRAASLYLMAGRYEEARDRAAAVLETDPSNANTHISCLGRRLPAYTTRRGVRRHCATPCAWRRTLPSRTSRSEAPTGRPDGLLTPKPSCAARWRRPQHVAANRALALLLMATRRPAEAEPLWRIVAASPTGLPFAWVDYLVTMNRLVEAEGALATLLTRDATRDAAFVRLAAVQYARNQR